jgi:hypothetical protein
MRFEDQKRAEGGAACGGNLAGAVKRIGGFAVFLLVALAAGAAPASQVRKGRSGDNKILEELIIANERAVWESVRTQNPAQFRRLVADDARMIFPSGVLTKSDFLRLMPQRRIATYALENFQFFEPRPGTTILIYRATRSGSFRGTPFPPESVREASVWVLRAGRWVAVLNQETPINP